MGINNIPPKICSYSCVYCQVGRTTELQIDRRSFYEPGEILRSARDKVRRALAIGERVDYLTFAPDGEPTLDVNLSREIDLLRPLGIKIAVITNSSLIWRKDVRRDLMRADWVSLKLDSTQGETWGRINRPHGRLVMNEILAGALEFAGAFRGKLVTETMLVEGLNDGSAHLEGLASFLARLQPEVAYLSIPIRPPAEAWARPPEEGVINQAYQILSEQLDQVECLTGYEGNAFAFTGDVESDLLSITAVHPMREEAVGELLARAGSEWAIVDKLVVQGCLVETEYAGRRFYVRKLL